MPCEKTATTVSLSKQMEIPKKKEMIQKCEITYSDYPPIFDLTNLEEGKCFAYLIASGLDGQIEINLTTKE